MWQSSGSIDAGAGGACGRGAVVAKVGRPSLSLMLTDVLTDSVGDFRRIMTLEGGSGVRRGSKRVELFGDGVHLAGVGSESVEDVIGAMALESGGYVRSEQGDRFDVVGWYQLAPLHGDGTWLV